MTQHSRYDPTLVAVIYSNTSEDPFEQLRAVDPTTLSFIPEYPLTVASVQEEYEAIVDALKKEGYEAVLLNLEDDISRLMNLIEHTQPDVVFNLIEMFRNDPLLESAIPALLELYEIPYTGAGPFALQLCQRKAVTKQVLLKDGVTTPGYQILDTPKIPRRHGLHYPLIVKPASEDASLGVEADSVVHNHEQLVKRVNKIFEAFDPPIMIEEFIDGKELHVSILGNDPPEVLPIIEFDFSSLPEGHPAIITYDVKWNPLEQSYHRVHSICPAQLPKKVESEVKKQALKAYKATACRDYARVDMRLSEARVPYVLEVNPNPDLTEGVSFMESADWAGLSFSRTLARIVELARKRSSLGAEHLEGQLR